MMKKYNILWLDDEPIKALPYIEQSYPEFSFNKVDYIDCCENIIEKDWMKYHAIILDANGLYSSCPGQVSSKKGLISLVKKIKEKKILVYIYSGQLDRAYDGEMVDITLESLNNYGLKEKEQIFYKTEGPYELFEKISSDLNAKYRYYVGNEYILSLFTKKWLDIELKKQFMDPLMEYYCSKDVDSAHGNQMRNIVENILDKLNETFDIYEVKECTPSRYKIIVKNIKIKKMYHSHSIIGPLTHMIEISNAESHNALDEIERRDYFDSDFSTFFIVLKWFNKLMSEYETSKLSSKGTKCSDIQDISNPPVFKDDLRHAVKVYTYKERNGTFFDIKIKVPKHYEDCKELYVSGIYPNVNDKCNSTWHVLYER